MEFQSKIIYRENGDCQIFYSNRLNIPTLAKPVTTEYYRANCVLIPAEKSAKIKNQPN